MVELLGLGPDCPIWDEPDVPGAAPVADVAPAGDVALVLERDADGQAINGRHAKLGEVEDGLVVVVEEAAAVDGLEVPDRIVPDGEGLHPSDGVLQGEDGPEGVGDVSRDPRVDVGAADVQEERALSRHDPEQLAADLA